MLRSLEFNAMQVCESPSFGYPTRNCARWSRSLEVRPSLIKGTMEEVANAIPQFLFAMYCGALHECWQCILMSSIWEVQRAEVLGGSYVTLHCILRTLSFSLCLSPSALSVTFILVSTFF